MPAPAVIPAPKAYINAVAVKGFVVELRVTKERFQSHSPLSARPPLLELVNIRNRARDRFLPNFRVSCTLGDARDFYCD